MQNPNTKILVKINKYPQTKKFVATFLLFAFLFQSCHTYTDSSIHHVKPTANQLIDQYSQQLPPENFAKFSTEVAPILKERLTTIDTEEERIDILKKILAIGIFNLSVLNASDPRDWYTKSCTTAFYASLDNFPEYFKSKSILPGLFYLLDKMQNYPQVIGFLDTMYSKYKDISIEKELSQVLKNIVEYDCDEDICSHAIETLRTNAPESWEDEIYKLVIDKTFIKSYELSTNEVISQISKNSVTKNPLIKEQANLEKYFCELMQVYNGCIENFEYLGPISNFSEKSIRRYTRDLEKKIHPYLNTLISIVMRAAELHNSYKPRDTQALAVIALLNKHENHCSLAQVNTGEGKSLIVAMLAAILALQGKAVDVVTTSTELSIPEVKRQKHFFHMLHLRVSDNSADSKIKNQRDAIYRGKNNSLEREGPFALENKNNFHKKKRYRERPVSLYFSDDESNEEEDESDLCADGYTKLNPYDNDIVYGTALDFQADILRSEFLKSYRDQGRGNRKFEAVIIDEVDSMLFDDRTHSTRLSTPTPAMNHLEQIQSFIWFYVNYLAQNIIRDNDKYYYVTEKFEAKDKEITIFTDQSLENSTIPISSLSEFLIDRTQEYLNIAFRVRSNTTGNASEIPEIKIPRHLRMFAISQIPCWTKSAMESVFQYKKNQHYSVKKGKIVPIDYQNTGVHHTNMVWKNGLAQMLQIKEGIPLIPESICTNSLAGVSFFKRYGHNLYGLTGTIGNFSTQNFFQEIYNTELIKIPPYKRCEIRNNHNSKFLCKELQAIIVPSEEEWYQQIVEGVLSQANHNRPVLVIFKYIDQVDLVAQKLKQASSKHKIFIYTGRDEDQFSKKTVECNDIILATNIAGRGTDFITTNEVEENGGLHICITFLPESYRVEMQNVGRTARQGRKGTTQEIIHHEVFNSIAKLRAIRDDKEAQAIKIAKRDVHNAIFRDKLFSKFCALEDSIFPSGELCKKMELLNLLRDQWQKNLDTVLTEEKIQDAYSDRVQLASEERYEEIRRDNAKEIDSNEKLTESEKQAKKEEFHKLKDLLVLILEDKITQNLPQQEFATAYTQNTLKAFCDIHRSLMPADVIDAMMDGKDCLPDVSEQAVLNDWGSFDRYAVEERWGVWLACNVPDSVDVDESAIEQKFEEFANDIRNDVRKNDFIENPYYFIKKGNANTSSERAADHYRRAISLAPNYSLHAHYNLALHLLHRKDHVSHYSTIIDHLNSALDQLRENAKPELATVSGYLESSSPKPELFRHIENQFNLLNLQEAYIKNTLEKVKFAHNRSWKIEVIEKLLPEAVNDASLPGNYDLAIGEMNVNGFFKVADLKVIEPPPPPPPAKESKTCEVATVIVLGIVQVAVGAVCMTTGIGVGIGAALIRSGVSDIIYGAKHAFSDEPFVWKDYWVKKGIDASIELISAGVKYAWDWAKENIKFLKNAFGTTATATAIGATAATTNVGAATTINLTSAEIVAHIGKEVLVQGGREMASYAIGKVYEETFEKDIQREIYDKVESKLKSFFATNSLINRAMAADEKHKKNFWEQTILEEGNNILAEDQSHIQSFFSKVTRGVANNVVPNAALFFQGSDALTALNDLLSYTEKFLKKLETNLYAKCEQKLKKYEDTPASESNSDHNFYAKSDPSKLTITFAGQITNRISASIRRNVVDPLASKAGNFTVEKTLEAAQKTLASTDKFIKGKLTKRTYKLDPTVPSVSQYSKDLLIREDEENSLNPFTTGYNFEDELSSLKDRLKDSINVPSMDLEKMLDQYSIENSKGNYDHTFKSHIEPLNRSNRESLQDSQSMLLQAMRQRMSTEQLFDYPIDDTTDPSLQQALLEQFARNKPSYSDTPTAITPAQQQDQRTEYMKYHDKKAEQAYLQEQREFLSKQNSIIERLQTDISRLNNEIILDTDLEMGSPQWLEKISEKEKLCAQLHEISKGRNETLATLGIELPEKSWNPESFYSEKSERLTKTMCKEFGTAFLQGSVESFMAPVQMILHPVATVEGIYEAFCKIPNLPEIIEQKWEEFSNLSEEERYVAIARGLGGALSNRCGIKIPVGGVGGNVGLAVGKVVGRIKVENMYQFFEKTEFGRSIKPFAERTKLISKDDQAVFKAMKKSEKGISKGEYFHLDKLHGDHLEVYDANKNFKYVLNLDGSINEKKTLKGKGRKLR